MKSVKLDQDVHDAIQINKKKGGFKSASELVRYALTMMGEVFEEHVTERQERQLLRLKLAEIHGTCEKIRELVTPCEPLLVDKYRLTNVK